jgi:RIO-like serine/threonine protein kinase
MASKAGAPVEIMSDDPEIVALQAMIRGLRHLGSKPMLTMRHFKIIVATELACRVTKKQAVPVGAISSFTGLKVEQFSSHLEELLEYRYLHKIIPTYGDATPIYKLGALGGTALHQIFRQHQPTPANKNEDYERKKIG